MSDNVRLFKNSTVLYIRLLITSILGLFTSRFIIQSLGAADFGLYTVVGGIIVMLAFLNNAMTATTYRYIAFELGKGDFNGVKKVFNLSLVLHLVIAVVVVIFAETFGEFYIRSYLNVLPNKLGDALFVFRMSVLAIFFSVFSIPFQALITAQEKFLVQAIIEIIRSLLGLCVAAIIVFYLGNKLKLYAVLMTIVLFMPPILFIAYCKIRFAEIVKWDFQRDKKKYKEMLGFSTWIMIGAGANVGKTQGAALLINSFFGTILNASFGIANQVNSIVILFSQNIGQAAVPQITKSFSSGNIDRTISLVSYISKYSVFFMLLPSLPLLLKTNYVLTLWLGVVPKYTTIFCQLMMINAIIDCLSSGIPAAIQATGKIKYFHIILSISSLLSLPIAYLFLKFGYAPSFILVTYIVTSLINIAVYQILLKRLINFDIKYFMKTSYLKIIYVVAFVSPLFFIRTLFPDSLIHFLLFSTITLIWFLIAVYFVGFEKKEKEMVASLIKKYLIF